MPLDPTMRDLLAAWGEPEKFDLTATRQAIDLLAPEIGDALPVASVGDRVIAGVPVRIYEPDASSGADPLVWCHGGGWVAGSLDAVDPICRALAVESGSPVISVDYRLAPEHPLPAALDDCVAVLRAVADQGRMAVGGDSAGGGLAAAACQVVRDEGLPVAAQVLWNPLLDATLSCASVREFATGFGLTRQSLQEFVRLYVGDADPADPRCSPLLARSLAGLPPAVIVTAEFDPLRDEAEEYGSRLREAGVEVHLRRWDGMVHGFAGMSSVTPAAAEALSWTVECLSLARVDHQALTENGIQGAL